MKETMGWHHEKVEHPRKWKGLVAREVKMLEELVLSKTYLHTP